MVLTEHKTEFDPQTHTYKLDGVEIPSVTQVLTGVGLIDATWFTEESAWRGSVVHACCQYDDEGDLDESSVPEEAWGYLRGWRRFKSETCIREFQEIEKPHFYDLYAGTPDRIVTYTDSPDGLHLNSAGIVLDIKTGAIYPSTAIQLAAYAHLVRPHLPLRRIAVRISADGTYRLQEFPIRHQRSDLQIFQCALACLNWKRRNL